MVVAPTMISAGLCGVLVLASAITAAPVAASGPGPVGQLRAGVWSWACGYAGYQGSKPPGFYEDECFDQVLGASPPQWLRGWFLLVYWKDIEPSPGVFNWTAFDANLTKAVANGLQVQPVVYIYDCVTGMPAWTSTAFSRIPFHRGGVDGGICEAPNYLDPAFQRRWQLVVEALAAHLGELPPRLREGLWAVQAVAGITGDNRPWDGVPQNSSDAISAAAWEVYSRAVADMYVAPLLTFRPRVTHSPHPTPNAIRWPNRGLIGPTSADGRPLRSTIVIIMDRTLSKC